MRCIKYLFRRANFMDSSLVHKRHAIPSSAPGLGIAWDFAAIKAQTVPGSTFTIS